MRGGVALPGERGAKPIRRDHGKEHDVTKCRVRGVGCRVQGLGCRDKGLRF